MTREELIKKLRALAKNNQDLSGDTELLDECRKLGLKDFDTTQPGKIADYLENNPLAESEVKKNDNLGSRQPNKAELDELVKIVEDHKEKSEKELVEIAQKNPLLQKVSVGETIKRQLELIKQAQIKKVKTEEINSVVKKTLSTEVKLKDEGIPTEQAEVLAEKIVDVAESSKTLEDCREKIAEVIKETKIGDKELAEEVVEATVAETADKIVEENVGKEVEKLTRGLADYKPTAEEIEEIEKAVRGKIETKLEDPTVGLNERKAVQSEEGGRVIIKTGNNLTEEITEMLGDKISGDKKTQIEVAVKNAEVDLNQNLFVVNQTNGNSPVDVVRREKLKEEIIARMTGSNIREAEGVAEMVAGLRFPPEESSNSAALVTAMKMLEENGFHGGDNPRLAEQAGIFRNLMRSKELVSENVNNILGVSDKLRGVKGFEQLESVAKTLKETPQLMKAMELMQKMVGFQDSVDKIAGWVFNPVEILFRVPAVQRLAVQAATRLGGEAAGAMATQIAEFGLKEGGKRILAQLLQKGSVELVKSGAKLAAQTGTKLAGETALDLGLDLGLTATVGGIPIAVVLLVIQLFQLAWEFVKPVLNFLKNKIEGALETVGIGSAKTKAALQDMFGGLVGKGLYYGGMVATGIVAFFGVAIGSIAISAWGIWALFGGLMFIQQGPTTQLLASVVAPQGMGEGPNAITAGPGTLEPGSTIPANPIFDNNCIDSPAFCVVAVLVKNGITVINKSNVAAVADFLVSWVKSGKAPASFNVDSFNSAMIASATEIGPDYVFQCVGFAVAVNPNLGSSSWGGDASSWQAMIAHGSAACPRIDPAGAGVGDFLLMPSGNWYHIQVLSKLNQDGSFAISQANWTGNGDVSNVSYGGDKNGTLANEKNLQKFLRGEIGDGLVKSVLRCQ